MTSSPSPSSSPGARTPSLWRHRNFRRYLTGHRSPLRSLLDMPSAPAMASPSAEAVTPPPPSAPVVPNPAVAADVRHDRSSEGGP